MSDSDSDFEILAVTNENGDIIDDKELLNAEFKKPKVAETILNIQEELPNPKVDTISSDEHFMDVEEDTSKNIQNTIVLDSQEAPVETVDIPKNSPNDIAMNQIMTLLSEEHQRGIMAIKNSQNVQEARLNFEQAIIATRRVNNLFKDVQSKLSNVLIVLKNKLKKKQVLNDTIAVDQLFAKQQSILKTLESNDQEFRTQCNQNTRDFVHTHEATIKQLGTFFNKTEESAPPQSPDVATNAPDLLKIQINKMKKIIPKLYDGTEQVEAEDNFFGTAETHTFSTITKLPNFKAANTPAQKQILDQFLSIKTCGYSVDVFLKKQEEWNTIQEENKLQRLERNTGSNDVEREYTLAITEYESNDDTLGLARILKRESPFLPDDVLKTIEQKTFNKLGMRYTIDDLKYRYSGWLDKKFDATIRVGKEVNVPRSLVIDDQEKYPLHLLDVNRFIVKLVEAMDGLSAENIKTLYKGYKVVADLLIRCAYATHILDLHLRDRKALYQNELLTLQKSNSFNPRTGTFGSVQLQNKYSKIESLVSDFNLASAETLKVAGRIKLAEKFLKFLSFTPLPTLTQLKKTLHLHRVTLMKKALVETGNAEFQKETAERFNIKNIEGTSANDGMNHGEIISATDIDDFNSLIQGMNKKNETSEVETPPEMNCQLMKHQKIGLHRLLELEKSNSKGGLLSDEMGLGKTIQMIALMIANRQEITGEGNEYTRQKYPILIVAPVSLLHNWKFEIESKVKAEYQFSITTFHESNKPEMFADLQKYDVVLTSYSTLGNEYKKHLPANYDKVSNSFRDSSGESRKFPSLPTINFIGSLKRSNEYESPFYQQDSMFYRIILDESHEIKNLETGKFKSCSLLRAQYRWCLSGTPIQNNVYDIFAVIKFLRIKPFMKDAIFREKIGRHLDLKKVNKKDTDSSSKREAERLLQGLISTISIRRTKDTKIDGQPLLTLPELNDHKVISVMDEDERLIYDQLEANLAAEAKLLIRNSNSPEAKQRPIFTLLLRLRQACIHFILVKVGELKSEMKKLTDSNYSKAWKHHVDEVKSQEVYVTLEANKFVEMGGPCSMCNEAPPAETNHLLQAKYVPRCGHCICGRCVETVDEEYRLVDPTIAELLFQCPKCNNQVIEDDLIPTALFNAIHNKGIEHHSELAATYKEFVDHVIKLKTEEANIDYSTLPTTAKIKQTIDLIKKIKVDDPDGKILIFCSFTTFFTLLSFFINKELQMPYVSFDGTMNVHQKSQAIDTFKNDPDVSLMLISLKAGNVGLTLTMANHVILVDPYWNPSVEDQAIGRAHRISQNKPVKVHRLLVQNTVEDRILNIQQRKKELAGAIIDSQTMKEGSALGSRELGYLFGLNALNDNRVDNSTPHVAADEAEFYE